MSRLMIQMAAQPVAPAQRALEIHDRPRARLAESGTGKGLGHALDDEPFRIQRDHGEAGELAAGKCRAIGAAACGFR